MVRFLAKTRRAESGCLEWTASVQSQGYGSFSVARSKTKLAHRWIYEATVGPISPGLTIDHLCRNRRCVEVAHLEPVPMAENNRRGNSATGLNARRTHCEQGHELAGDNLRIRANGARVCKACNRAANRATWRKQNPVQQYRRKPKPNPEVKITPPVRAVSLVLLGGGLSLPNREKALTENCPAAALKEGAP